KIHDVHLVADGKNHVPPIAAQGARNLWDRSNRAAARRGLRLAGGEVTSLAISFILERTGYPLDSPHPKGLCFAGGFFLARVNYLVASDRIDGDGLLRQA